MRKRLDLKARWPRQSVRGSPRFQSNRTHLIRMAARPPSKPHQRPNTNKHGLSRTIPADVKRAVRQRCGFGCVICGDAIVEYEHVEPLFAEAEQHDNSRITLLCPSHHSQSTKGLLAKSTIRNADRSPFCKRGYSPKHLLNIGSRLPTIMVGGNDLTHCGGRVFIGGRKVFEVSPPDEVDSTVWQLFARLFGPDGRAVCEIDRNEISFDPQVFDIIQQRNRFEVRDVEGHVLLCITSLPPHGISLDRFEAAIPGGRYIVAEEEVETIDRTKSEITLTRANRPALVFETRAGGRVVFTTSQMVSSTGLYLDLQDGALRIGANPGEPHRPGK